MGAGRVSRTAPPLDLDFLRSRFWERVAIGDEHECWNWSRSMGSHGYGQAWDGITVRLAHRCAWELAHGRIPDGLTVDHLCRNRRCCNPGHLQLLTNQENAAGNGHSLKESCPSGHPYSETNTYRNPTTGHRTCITCRDANKAAWEARRHGATF